MNYEDALSKYLPIWESGCLAFKNTPNIGIWIKTYVLSKWTSCGFYLTDEQKYRLERMIHEVNDEKKPYNPEALKCSKEDYKKYILKLYTLIDHEMQKKIIPAKKINYLINVIEPFEQFGDKDDFDKLKQIQFLLRNKLGGNSTNNSPNYQGAPSYSPRNQWNNGQGVYPGNYSNMNNNNSNYNVGPQGGTLPSPMIKQNFNNPSGNNRIYSNIRGDIPVANNPGQDGYANDNHYRSNSNPYIQPNIPTPYQENNTVNNPFSQIQMSNNTNNAYLQSNRMSNPYRQETLDNNPNVQNPVVNNPYGQEPVGSNPYMQNNINNNPYAPNYWNGNPYAQNNPNINPQFALAQSVKTANWKAIEAIRNNQKSIAIQLIKQSIMVLDNK